jgi:hypothetical protein
MHSNRISKGLILHSPVYRPSTLINSHRAPQIASTTGDSVNGSSSSTKQLLIESVVVVTVLLALETIGDSYSGSSLTKQLLIESVVVIF